MRYSTSRRLSMTWTSWFCDTSIPASCAAVRPPPAMRTNTLAPGRDGRDPPPQLLDPLARGAQVHDVPRLEPHVRGRERRGPGARDGDDEAAVAVRQVRERPAAPALGDVQLVPLDPSVP